ncbi:SusC/RagA family TonB-linked outer membrane protein [Elizabethkingia anophelis]|nr:SusC/RagA family TonB-linked outer membrane protein [Elizabethkingia anophelis]
MRIHPIVPSNYLKVAIAFFLSTSGVQMAMAQQTPNRKVSTKADTISKSKDIDEVVVVGYGKQKKSNMTTAVSSISKEVLESRPVPNIMNAMQGAAPGVVVTRTSGRPGGQNFNIEVRGASSMNGSIPPLYVVDGITVSDQVFNTINPDDIENISILKDGAAASIYGARAGGGVVIVTTKTGTKGKVRVSYGSIITSMKPLNIPKRMSLLEEAEYANIAYNNAGQSVYYDDIDMGFIRNGIEWGINPNKNKVSYQTYNQHDIYKQLFHDNYYMMQNNLSVQGGSDKVSYFASMGYLQQNGLFKVGPDAYDKWNTRLNLTAKLSDKITMDVRMAYAKESFDRSSRTVENGGSLSTAFSARQKFPIFNPDGSFYGAAGSSGNLTYMYQAAAGFNKRSNEDFNNSVSLTGKDIFVKGLTLKAVYGRENYYRKDKTFNRTVKTYDWTINGPIAAAPVNPTNSYSVYNESYIQQNTQFQIDYDFAIDKHKFHVMGGFQWEDYYKKTETASATNLIVNDNPSLNYASDAKYKSNSEGQTGWAQQSYFGRFTYEYDGKYLLEGTIRRDESSRLSPGFRADWFKSASAGWNMHKESWFNSALPFFSMFKPRVSYGEVANANSRDLVGDFDFLNGLSFGTNVVLGDNGGDRNTYVTQGRFSSNRLKWERVVSKNLGLDFALFSNKLTGSFDIYRKDNRNNLVRITLPSVFGYQEPYQNQGILKTTGWEFSLGYNGRIGKDFTFNVSGNIADSKNKVEYKDGSSYFVYSGRNNIIEGYEMNTIWGYKTNGYIQNADQLKGVPYNGSKTGIGDVRYVDMNGDGQLNGGLNTVADHGDLVYLGSDNPRYTFGFNFSSKWKNVDFSFRLQGVGKRTFMYSTDQFQPLAAAWVQPISIHLDYWTPDNPNAAFPRPFVGGGHNFLPSDKWVLNGAYVRLKNVQLGYSLSPEALKKLPITRLRFYVTAEDILTFSKLGVWKGIIDPEQKNQAYADYPLSSSIAFGVNIDF